MVGKSSLIVGHSMDSILSFLSLIGTQLLSTSYHVVQEDFFERTMREREEEVLKMNSKMHQVNHIYKVSAFREM